MCGILALLLAQQQGLAAPEINEALSLLQHRGQDAAGIVTCGARGRFYQCKANGMVRDVFNAGALARLQGSMGVGHGAWCGDEALLAGWLAGWLEMNEQDAELPS